MLSHEHLNLSDLSSQLSGVESSDVRKDKTFSLESLILRQGKKRFRLKRITNSSKMQKLLNLHKEQGKFKNRHESEIGYNLKQFSCSTKL
jgi:hypothetical protein